MDTTTTRERALAIVLAANQRAASEYSALAGTLREDGASEEDIFDTVNHQLINDASFSADYLNDKIDRLAAEKETATGMPVKTVAVDFFTVDAPVPLKDSVGNDLPSSILNGLWIANGYIASMLKIEGKLTQ